MKSNLFILMRLIYLSFCLLIPHFLFAQLLGLSSFEPGSYVLASNPTNRIEAGLKLKNGDLVTKDFNGKKAAFNTQQVISFRIGERMYITATGFVTKNGILGTTNTKAKFVELLDSGQVILMRYTHTTSNGGGPYGAGGAEVEEYLLRRASESTVTLLETNGRGGGKQFRETLLPYFSTRPDLINLLNNKEINTSNLTPFIHALNAGSAYIETK